MTDLAIGAPGEDDAPYYQTGAVWVVFLDKLDDDDDDDSDVGTILGAVFGSVGGLCFLCGCFYFVALSFA